MKLIKEKKSAYITSKSEGCYAYIHYTLFVICFNGASRRKEIKMKIGKQSTKILLMRKSELINIVFNWILG